MNPQVMMALITLFLQKGLPHVIDLIVALNKPADQITMKDIEDLGELPDPETFFKAKPRSVPMDYSEGE